MQEQIDQLKAELQSFKDEYYYNRFSSVEIKTKNVQFNGKVGFYKKTPIVQNATITAPTGGTTEDTQARSSINEIKTFLTFIGLTK